MENNNITGVLMAFDAMLKKSATEFDRKLEESQKRFELYSKESQERLDLYAKESQERFDRNLKESQDRLDLYAKESQERFDRKLEESRVENNLRKAELDKLMRNLTEQVTGVSKSNGLFATDYFYNSFEKDRIFFGETFDKIIREVKGRNVDDEYDIVLINGKTAVIVEIKYRARKDDIEKTLKKVNTFRTNFPEYNNHKIYLALASLTIHKELVLDCNRKGIAVVKQIGDKVIVYDKHMKAF